MSTHSTPYPSVLDYVRVLRVNRWLIVIVTLVIAGAALVFSVTQKKVYTAAAALSVRDQSQDLALVGNTAISTLPAVLAAEHATVVLRSGVLAAAGRALNLTTAQVRNDVTISVEAQTNFVDVTANAATGDLAARVANTVANQDAALTTRQDRAQLAAEAAAFAKKAKALPGSANAATQALNAQRTSALLALSSVATPVRVQAQAHAPSAPSSPKPVRDTLIGAGIGLIIGVLISFLRSAVDRRLVDAQEIVEAMQLPMIGNVHADTLGFGRAGENGRTRFDGQDMEAFRMLRQSVDYLAERHSGEQPASTILVTSSTPSEGKSTVALGLALANAAAGKRTLLVECDLRRPVLASRLGLRSGPGLGQYLADQADAPDVLQTVAISSAFDVPTDNSRELTCIVAGDHTSEPAELLGSDRFVEFIQQVRQVYETVVVDSTPLLSVVDALELAVHCDRVLMCVRAHQTTRQEAVAGGSALRRVPARPTGVVVTGVGKHDGGDYGYYSYAGAYALEAGGSSPNGNPRARESMPS